jgi:hypothetical protein
MIRKFEKFNESIGGGFMDKIKKFISQIGNVIQKGKKLLFDVKKTEVQIN